MISESVVSGSDHDSNGFRFSVSAPGPAVQEAQERDNRRGVIAGAGHTRQDDESDG